ncbi:collagen alpha-1(XV) chain-like [Cyclospora cayetanensis]|uniref:Collagen alpha-1(XV) chain-like n=1 Tax=Cyclospora cayetanensis TaxID=88456 RepID=A0A6P6S4S0_9EIME|nr:collagen alpha-1(XV) chain-like [Cyclospora cayetanensis]
MAVSVLDKRKENLNEDKACLRLVSAISHMCSCSCRDGAQPAMNCPTRSPQKEQVFALFSVGALCSVYTEAEVPVTSPSNAADGCYLVGSVVPADPESPPAAAHQAGEPNELAPQTGEETLPPAEDEAQPPQAPSAENRQDLGEKQQDPKPSGAPTAPDEVSTNSNTANQTLPAPVAASNGPVDEKETTRKDLGVSQPTLTTEYQPADTGNLLTPITPTAPTDASMEPKPLDAAALFTETAHQSSVDQLEEALASVFEEFEDFSSPVGPQFGTTSEEENRERTNGLQSKTLRGIASSDGENGDTADSENNLLESSGDVGPSGRSAQTGRSSGSGNNQSSGSSGGSNPSASSGASPVYPSLLTAAFTVTSSMVIGFLAV